LPLADGDRQIQDLGTRKKLLEDRNAVEHAGCPAEDRARCPALQGFLQAIEGFADRADDAAEEAFADGNREDLIATGNHAAQSDVLLVSKNERHDLLVVKINDEAFAVDSG
jgi:hypothetical protein